MSEELLEEIARLRRTVELERRARLEAEAISEAALLDVSRERARLELLRAIATAANEATSLDHAFVTMLSLVCESLDWPLGQVYRVEPGPPERLVPQRSWHARRSVTGRADASGAGATPLGIDEGLPGLALRTGAPVWTNDLPPDARFGDAPARTAIAFGVRDGVRHVAVLELLRPTETVVADDAVALLALVSSQLGRVAERSRSEAELRSARDELEERVCDRTVEIEAVNAELRVKIAEQVRSEKALRLSEARYQRLIDNAHDLIYTRDTHGVVTSMNAAGERMLGIPRDELIGKNVDGLLTAEYRSSGVLDEWRDMVPGEQRVFVVEVQTRDGRRVPIEVSASLVVEDGLIVGLQGTGRDITEQQRAQELMRIAHDAAVDSARVKAQFLANMSHEIRTPLNGIIGLTHLLERTSLTPKQREYVDTLERSGRTLLHIVDDVLDLSKAESGKMTIERAEVDLRAICFDVVRVFAELAESRGVELMLDFADDVPETLVGDALRVSQVVGNLVGNAVKFTHEGEITLRARLASQTGTAVVVRFEVEDTGIGVDTAAASKLFTPFTQADGSTTRMYGGTGLGLAICKELVALMKGEIGLLSTPGEGSTFWFTTQFEVGAQVERREGRRAFRGVRVLVVDDNARSRALVGRDVAALGMDRTLVDGPASALAALRAAADEGAPFHLAVVDLEMPETDGLAVARAVATDPATAATKIVILTPHHAHADVDASAHVDGWLTKPVDRRALEVCLRHVLQAEGGVGRIAERGRTGPLRAPGSRARILLVEDYPVNRLVAVGLLEDLGCAVDEAENGAEALEKLDAATYDLVLMDCQMPVLDGFEATEALRAREKERGLARTPVVAITANALDVDRVRCLAAGMDDFLAKPFLPSDLEALLARFLDGAHAACASHAEPLIAHDDQPTLDPETFRQLRLIAERREITVSQFYGEFIQHATAGLDALRRAAPDVVRLAPAAHSLKGASAMYGAFRMARICAEIESLGADGAPARTGALLDALADEVRVVETIVSAGGGALEAGVVGV